MKFFNLKPKGMSNSVKKEMEVTEDVVVVTRDDGKEFTIARNQLANHLDRGFTTKDKQDKPQVVAAQKGFADSTVAAEKKAEAVPEYNADGVEIGITAIDLKKQEKINEVIKEEKAVAKKTK